MNIYLFIYTYAHLYNWLLYEDDVLLSNIMNDIIHSIDIDCAKTTNL